VTGEVGGWSVMGSSLHGEKCCQDPKSTVTIRTASQNKGTSRVPTCARGSPFLLKMKTYIRKMDAELETFGKNLRHIRRQKGLTQTELGKKVGLSKRMIIHYEKHAKRPPGDKLVLLAQALATTPAMLLHGDIATSDDQQVDAGFARRLEKAKRLPPSDRQVVASLIDTLLKKNDMHVKRPRKGKCPPQHST
jgi:transcriptional regulator with XRE-family HTH domain